jgi:mono/diheme cytochrome c family protein
VTDIVRRKRRALGGGALLIASVACTRTAPPGPDQAPGSGSSSTVTSTVVGSDAKRGEHLATIFTCVDCHTVRAADGIHASTPGRLAGGRMYTGPFGTLYSPNVTVLGPGFPLDFLEKDIRGQNRGLAVMPAGYFNAIARDDMRDLIAFLHGLTGKPQSVLADQRISSWTPPPASAPLAVPDTAPTGRSASRGEYLATVTGCGDCHTPKTAQGVDDRDRPLSGGGKRFPGADGGSFEAPNLTSDPGTGLGAWTDAQIVAAIRQGKARDGHALDPEMPYGTGYADFTDDEVQSIVLYLRSLRPVKSNLPANPVWQPSRAE